MVFIYHLRWIAGEPRLFLGSTDWQPLLKRLDIGVCLFFVLSGYLLSGPFWSGLASGKFPDLGKYLVRRVARILPAYWLLLFTFNVFAPGTYKLWGAVGVILQILCLHNFADYVYTGSVPVLWSIGIEWQFYFLLPLLFLFGRKISGRRKWAAGLIMAAAALLLDFAWRSSVPLLVGHVPGKILPSALSRVATESSFYFLKWFAIGMAGAWLLSQFPDLRKVPRRFWDGLLLTGASLLALIVLNSYEGQWRSISLWGWPMNAVACTIIVVSCPRSIAASILETTPLRFLGAISYGIYLWHWPILKAVFGGTLGKFTGTPSGFFVGGLISLFLTLLVASLSYLAVERPAIQWARRQPSAGQAWRSLVDWLSFTSDGSPAEIAPGRPLTPAAKSLAATTAREA
jgi:peptidoglycan/LPS O-acetylase OafA/YrhL